MTKSGPFWPPDRSHRMASRSVGFGVPLSRDRHPYLRTPVALVPGSYSFKRNHPANPQITRTISKMVFAILMAESVASRPLRTSGGAHRSGDTPSEPSVAASASPTAGFGCNHRFKFNNVFKSSWFGFSARLTVLRSMRLPSSLPRNQQHVPIELAPSAPRASLGFG